MTDTANPTSNQENLTRMVREIEAYSKQTGDWRPWRTVEQLVAECVSAVRTGQSPEQTRTNMAAIMRNYEAHYHTKAAQKTNTATQVTHARKAGV